MSVTITITFLFAMRKSLMMNRGLQNSCLILMMAIPWEKKMLVYLYVCGI